MNVSQPNSDKMQFSLNGDWIRPLCSPIVLPTCKINVPIKYINEKWRLRHPIAQCPTVYNVNEPDYHEYYLNEILDPNGQYYKDINTSSDKKKMLEMFYMW
eukprot:NODE_291_length_10603_cov_1.029703.p9 type:complete len:101 gc:universal NODE_291_length_10603_cov_1.029703:6725-7027(+)